MLIFQSNCELMQSYPLQRLVLYHMLTSSVPRQMVLIMGSLLVVLFASAIDAVTGAAATDTMECFSPLDIVGLDNCPELNSNGGPHNNSIVENLLAAKADMLRQVSQTIRSKLRPS